MDNVKSTITEHQLHQIFSYLEREYSLLGTKIEKGKPTFGQVKSPWPIPIPTPKTIIPFKKYLWPDNQNIDSIVKKNIAFVGLTNCDALALVTLLKEFSRKDLLPTRSQILIVSTECKKDEDCFCTAFGNDNIKNFDLHLQKGGKNFTIFAGSDKGEEILKANGIKPLSSCPSIKKIELEEKEKINLDLLEKAIDDKNNLIEYWQDISKECFGCGACSMVCPLCFCVRRNIVNETDGSAEKDFLWDSCFSKSFSEIAHGQDFRPDRTDRLYNWYHHKFVRSPRQFGHILCTGCGRCIKTCPANLNQYKIMLGAIHQHIENKASRNPS